MLAQLESRESRSNINALSVMLLSLYITIAVSIKIMKENFPNLVKEIDMQVQEAHRVPNKMDAKRSTPRHIINNIPKVKDKERILKAAREKQLLIYRVVPIRLSADFSKETLQARKDWQEILKVMKSRDL